MRSLILARGLLLLVCASTLADPAETLPGTRPLTGDRDLSRAMLDGLHRFADRRIDASVDLRAKLWDRDPSSREAYEKSVAPSAAREKSRRLIRCLIVRTPSWFPGTDVRT